MQSSKPDDRNRQEKALQAWDKQEKAWNRMQENLARRFDKSVGETLSGSIHQHRQKNQDIAMIDCSVPEDIRNGMEAWEMHLRGGGAGIRYVPLGSSYPYPLFVPLRDPAAVSDNSNHMMRVVPPQMYPRSKPVSETQYYQSRTAEFKKHIRKRFAHFGPNPEFLCVEGSLPPLAAHRPSDKGHFEPVVSIPMQEPTQAKSATGLPPPIPSRPLSCIAGQTDLVAPSTTGPMLSFSASHLSITATPGELSQATLLVQNIGTTAVFFSWTAVNAAQAHLFRMSDASNGALLPEDSKYFTVAIRSPHAGIFSKQFEILTVPVCKERIIVTVTATVIGSNENVVAVRQINKEITAAAHATEARVALLQPFTQLTNNALDCVNIADEIRELQRKSREPEEKKASRTKDCAAQWKLHNGSIPFHSIVFEHCERMFVNVSKLLLDYPQVCARPSSAPTMAKSSPASPPITSPIAPTIKVPVKAPTACQGLSSWDGDIHSLVEKISLVRSSKLQRTLLQTMNLLVALAKEDGTSLRSLLWTGCGRDAFGHMADEFVCYQSSARDLCDGKIAIKKSADLKDPKASKAAPPPKKAVPSPKVPLAQADAECANNLSKHPHFDGLFFAGARVMVLDAIMNMIERKEAAMSDIINCCNHPLSACLIAAPYPISPECDIDVTSEVNVKGKKK